eukprot:TRINITY_DN8793_c0_g2_i4.p1 TRINITY_DN8793_c0_g2~~TRINITY_DN8793_c0_g2_i4.p1  ORF type:complete len:1462 (+),score=228.86 TRINITY_DN8793_c0_g2_i4:40-4425(+)
MSSQRRSSWKRKDSGNSPSTSRHSTNHGLMGFGISVLHRTASPQSDVASEEPKNFPIFQFVKLVGLRSNTPHATPPMQVSLEPSSPGKSFASIPRPSDGSFSDSSQASEKDKEFSSAPSRDCTVSAVFSTIREYSHHRFMALYLSNDYLLFRYVGRNGLPIIRQLKWFKEPPKRILAMTFSPEVDWFLAVTSDCTIFILPTQLILKQDQTTNQITSLLYNTAISGNPDLGTGPVSISTQSSEQQGSNRGQGDKWKLPSLLNFARASQPEPEATPKKPVAWSADDITVIPPTPPRIGTISCCRWWNTQSGVDYALLSTLEGSIIAINLSTQTEVVFPRLKHPIITIDVICDPKENYKFLLIQTKGSGCFRLLLEANIGGVYDNIIQTPTRTVFSMTPLTRFAQNLTITKQEIHHQPVFGVFHPSGNKLEVYDEDFSKYALFVYHLPPGTINYHLTERFIFAVCRDSLGEKIVVISTLMAGTSAEQSYKYTKSGFAGTSNRQQTDAAMQEFRIHGNQHVLGFFRASKRMRDRDNASDQGALDGVYIWLADGLYELRPKQAPEQIFKKLVLEGHDAHAELLGKSIGLDLLSLYEEIADNFYSEGDIARSLQLYNLSNVSTAKLIFKFLEADRLDVVMSVLKKLLADKEALPLSLLRKLSDVMVRCYIYSILSDDNDEEARAQVRKDLYSFLKDNQDYTAAGALIHLISAGLKDQFLQVAHSRALMPKALSMLVNRGNLRLGTNELTFLRENGYGDLLQVSADGILLDCLNVAKQLQVIMEDGRGIAIHYNRIIKMLPLLKREQLLELANFLDPNGEHFPTLVQKLQDDEYYRRTPEAYPVAEVEERTPLSLELLVEMYLTVLLACKSCHSEDANRPGLRADQLLTPMREKFESFEHIPSMPNDDGVRAQQISCGWSHSAMITGKGAVYTSGNNDFGQLGHGNTRTYPQFMRVMSLKNTKIIQVSCGAEHTLALSDSGEVFTWGRGQHGQLGLGVPFNQHVPRKIDISFFNGKIVSIASGHYHSLAVTDKNSVYGWGSNSHGQIGVGASSRKVIAGDYRGANRPQSITDLRSASGMASGDMRSSDPRVDQLTPCHIASLDGKRIAMLSGGFCHSVALSENGDIYCWGGGQSGQLGHASTRDQPTPLRIDAGGKRFVSVQCGAFHTAAVTDLGGVYTWGRGTKHRLGHAESLVDQLVPKWVAALSGASVTGISCGHYHTAALCSATDELYMWGDNSCGQLGLGHVDGKSVPTQMSSSVFPARIHAIACGEEFAFALLENHQLYSWGRSDSGRLGLGGVDVPHIATPTLVDLFLDGPIPSGVDFRRSGARTSVASIYGQKTLEDCLRDRFRFYRPTVMVRRCLDWGNWSAASIIYEQMEDWPEALECKLRTIDEDTGSNEHHVNSENIQPIFSFLSRTKDDSGRSRILLQIFKFWKCLSLPIQPLEAFLVENSDTMMVSAEFSHSAE